jgi:Fur family zinc uptake transcriptional regulator
MKDSKAPEAPRLSATQTRVKALLDEASGPLSAYDLLDRMRVHGAITPPTVYRALDALIAAGFVHRLESLNAYVACRHEHSHHLAAFAICENCGAVTEFTDSQIGRRLSGWSAAHAFRPKQVTLEMRGYCEACAA